MTAALLSVRRRLYAVSLLRSISAAGSITAPLIAGASLKIFYDFALWSQCRKVKPPEER